MFQWEKLKDRCFDIPCINAFYLKMNIFDQLSMCLLGLHQDGGENTSLCLPNMSMNNEAKIKEKFLKCLCSTETFLILCN